MVLTCKIDPFHIQDPSAVRLLEERYKGCRGGLGHWGSGLGSSGGPSRAFLIFFRHVPKLRYVTQEEDGF